MTNGVSKLEKTHLQLKKEPIERKFPTEFLQNLIRWKAWWGDISIKFCSDWMSGSHSIMQKSNFLFISATAMTFGQVIVIHYIFPDKYFLCPKYLRPSLNGLDVGSKSMSSGGRHDSQHENELKAWSLPRQCDLMMTYMQGQWMPS